MKNLLSIVARNSFINIFGRLTVKAISLLFTIYIIRRLGDADYGQYVIIWSYITIFAMFSDAGLGLYAIREIAKKNLESHYIAANIIVLRLVLASLTIALIVGVGGLVGYSQEMLGYILLGSFILLLYAVQDPLDATLQAVGRFDLAAVALIAGQLIFVISGALFLGWGWHVTGLILAALLNVLVSGAVAGWWLRHYREYLQWRIQPGLWAATLRASFSFGLIKLWLAWALRIDMVILSLFWFEQMAGWYGAAYAIILGITIISNSINTALYPVLSRQYAQNPTDLPAVYELALKYLLLLAWPIAGGIYLTADRWLPLLYGAQFTPAASALAILVWVIPLAFASEFFRYVLIATSRERTAVWGLGAVVIFNVLLNLWWIPQYGFLAAALITVASEALLVSLYSWSLRGELRSLALAKILLAPLLATLVMMAVVDHFAATYLLLQVALGGLVYALLIGLLRVVKREEVDQLFNLRKPKSTDSALAVVAQPELRSQPLVSVFILVYNGEQYVAQAIESVLRQSYQPYELIIIDDGSTDQTPHILSQYQDRPHLTLYTNRQNLGISPTWNKAVSLCRGELIAKLDADDYYEPRQLETVVNFFRQHQDVGLIFSGLNLIYPDGRVEPEMAFLNSWVRHRPEFLPTLLKLCVIRAPTVFVNRDCYERLGGVIEPMKLHSDWEMWVRIAANYPVGFIAQRLAYYRMSYGPNATAQAGVDGRSMADLRLWLKLLAQGDLPYCLTDAEQEWFRWGIYELEMHFAAMAACQGQPALQQAYVDFAEEVIPTRLSAAEMVKLRRVHTHLHQGLFAFREQKMREARGYFWQAIKTEPRYCTAPWIWSKLLLTFIGRTKWGLMYK